MSDHHSKQVLGWAPVTESQRRAARWARERQPHRPWAASKLSKIMMSILAGGSLAEKLCPRTLGLWDGRWRKESGATLGSRTLLIVFY